MVKNILLFLYLFLNYRYAVGQVRDLGVIKELNRLFGDGQCYYCFERRLEYDDNYAVITQHIQGHDFVCVNHTLHLIRCDSYLDDTIDGVDYQRGCIHNEKSLKGILDGESECEEATKVIDKLVDSDDQ